MARVSLADVLMVIVLRHVRFSLAADSHSKQPFGSAHTNELRMRSSEALYLDGKTDLEVPRAELQ